MTQSDRRGLDPNPDANRDPITGTPGSHPVGTAAGAVAGAVAAGAAAGTLAAGPVGTVVGAALGAVAGGLGRQGHRRADRPDRRRPLLEGQLLVPPVRGFRRQLQRLRPGVPLRLRDVPKYHGQSFDDIESDLSRDWDSAKGTSRLTWNEAKYATKDSFQRVSDAIERAVPGDSDRDGK